jgi:hypothetical protein
MEQLVILNPDGSQYPLKRLYPLTDITRAVQSCDLLGQDVVDVDFESTEHLEMLIGMRIFVYGKYYTLNVLPEEQKSSTREFLYKCRFEGPQYALMSCRYFNTDASGLYTGSDFSLTGNIETFIDVLIYNCNRTFGSGKWVKGDVQASDTKTLTFSNVNCLQALQLTICKEFEVEFEITQSGDVSIITVKKVGQVLLETYQYGKGKGLYTLTRRPVGETTIVNRLYPEGSTENLKVGYRNYSSRLRIGDPNSGQDYIEDAGSIAAFGLIEGVKIFEDIKPHREGIVTGIIVDNPLKFVDLTMNFNLNEKEGENTKYLVAGKSAKIHFNTGDLAGYEFEIIDGGYIHEENSFTIIPITDAKGLKIPSIEPFTIKMGDKYVIIDIVMPQVYIDEAEADLATQAQIYLDANKAPMVAYGLSLEREYLKDKAPAGSIPNFFSLGDYVQIKDTDLGIDNASRIIKFTRNVLDPFVYSLEVADTYQIDLRVRILSDIKQLNNIVVLNNLMNPVTQRQSWRSAQELTNIYFDQDGYLKDGKIRAETLETAIALIGTDSGQLQVIGATFQANFQGQKNVVAVSAGQIVHLTVEPTIRTWNFNATGVGIADDGFRYVYARCNRTGSDASIVFSTSKIKTKEDASFYHFLLGILNSVDADTQTRRFSLTYGFTLIAGEWITTGTIQSADGSTGFNLNTGEIYGNIKFRAANGVNKDISDLETELKGLIQDVSEQTDGQVESWFLNGAPTLTNEPAIQWNTLELKMAHVGDNYFDNVSKKSYRFRQDSGVFSWQEVTDDRITQALLLASQAKDTADGKRRIFMVQPTTPYDVGDAWNKSTGWMVCKTQRLTGSFNPLDWELARIYDNTVTAINGGMAVTGALYLANADGTIKAFIRGGGTDDNEILLGLGASVENAEFAPFRARRSGVLELRKSIELFNSSNQGVAGICGINSAGDGLIVAWFGTNYSNRANAPTRIDMNGKFTTVSARIGGWEIDSNGLTNQDGNGYIIASSSNASKRTEAMIGANVFPAIFGGKGAASFKATEDTGFGSNYGAVFEADGAPLGFHNFALYAGKGKSMLSEGLINGRSTYVETISTTITRGIDPSIYDAVRINATGGVVGLGFLSPTIALGDGKEITILSENDDRSIYLVNIIRGRATVEVGGGVVCTIVYFNGHWLIKGMYNNDY